jgi:hypothetical protein
MLTRVFICILAAVILFGNIAHFRAMAILAQYGIRVPPQLEMEKAFIR